ncbi:MAG: DUF3943 domain-containing protein [Staphylococcus sp.]|nr:DUF3943 domain-containing protein [Staphylococcus sp.]
METREKHTGLLTLLLAVCLAIADMTPAVAGEKTDTFIPADFEVRRTEIDVEPLSSTSAIELATLRTVEDVESDTLIPRPVYEFRQRAWSPYLEPYTRHGSEHRDWHRMWINTAVLSGAFVGTLFVLECLPEDATSWNRASIQQTEFYTRWYRNIFVKNPEIDHDNAIFNYVLHPYAGAAYFMAARSCGFSFWGSMLYSALVSTVGWEFGIEACMERPSYQDIIITPVVGSLLGELFYKCKRHIVEHDYTLWGSRVLGNIVVFLVDPVNEVVNLFRGSYERKAHLGVDNPSVNRPGKHGGVTSSLMPTIIGGAPGFTFTCNF